MTATQKTQENKMGTMPVKQLLITMSLPMIISMLIQALYNIVDSIFVSQISENTLTAVSMAFPIQNLMIAVAAGTGVGVNALLSRNLGEKNFRSANLAANNGILLAICSYLLFLIFGLTMVEPYYLSHFSEEELLIDPEGCQEIITAGINYLRICTVFSIGIFVQITFERLLMSTGKTFYNMITQGTGAIINIILDPILIFGYLGFPKLGVSGAAIATITGQLIAMSLGIIFNQKKNKEIHLTLRDMKPHFPTIGAIYAVGLPSIIMQSIGSIMTYGMNRILNLITPTAVSVFGIYFKLQSFIFMPIFGLNNGMVPIVAYNYGARNKKRILDTIRLSVFIAVGIMLFGLLIFQLIPGLLLKLFEASDEMLTIGIPALRTISISFLFAGYCIIISSVFQALGNGVYSLLVSVFRQLIVILPAAWILANQFGLRAVWYSFPLAELVSLGLCTFFLFRIYQKKLKQMENETICQTNA